MSNKNNKNLAIMFAVLTVGMILLAYAFVPLYNIFCKATGFGGTTQIAKTNFSKIGKKTIRVNFDANVDPKLNWSFKPLQNEISVRTGESAVIFYEAQNNSDKDIIGTAVYNVTPHKAALYFNKIECFCFQEQMLKAGEKVNMPVSFFIDSKMEEDLNLEDIENITLSYSFFMVKEHKK